MFTVPPEGSILPAVLQADSALVQELREKQKTFGFWSRRLQHT
jgi:hypothetical protein